MTFTSFTRFAGMFCLAFFFSSAFAEEKISRDQEIASYQDRIIYLDKMIALRKLEVEKVEGNPETDLQIQTFTAEKIIRLEKLHKLIPGLEKARKHLAAEVDIDERNCSLIENLRQKKICYVEQEMRAEKVQKEARKQRARLETPIEKKAREKVERQEKNNEKYEKRRAEAVRLTRIEGCEEGTVRVEPAAAKPSRWRVAFSLDVTNGGFRSVNLRDPVHGILVRNLCAGGQMTLHFHLAWEDSNYVDFPITATMRFPDGEIAEAQYTVQMNRFSGQYKRQEALKWTIQPQRVYRSR